MRYELLHRDRAVALVTIHERDGMLTDLDEIVDREHLPVGVVVPGRPVDVSDIRSWWYGRSIPASRRGIRDVLERLGFRDASMLLTNSLGLSLSDQYWIRPQGSDISWEDVNFFDNPFSEDVGDLLFGHHVGEGEIDLNSPDNTSDGNLRKRWKIVDGRRCLIKSGTRPMFQEPFNEVAASMLAEAAGIPHVDYRIVSGGGDPCCICSDFITRDTELVTAHSVLLSDGLDGGVRMLERYVGACRYHGLDVRDDVNAMIAFDHIIANTDRHTNNFGIIRDAETLEWLSSAPLYDNGTSLGTNVLTADLTSDLITGCKPFADTFRKQIGLVSTLDGIDTESMRGEIPKIRNLMEEGIRYLGDGRSDAVCSLISDRLDEVESRRERMLTWHVPAV